MMSPFISPLAPLLLLLPGVQEPAENLADHRAELARREEAADVQRDSAQLDAIIAEFDEAMDLYVRTWNAAPEEDRPAVTERLYILPDDEFIPRILHIVRAHPGTELAARCLAWVVENSRGMAGEYAVTQLIEEHLDSPHTISVCNFLESDFEEGQALLTHLAQESKLRALRGHARLSLALHFITLCEFESSLHTPGGRKQYADWYGEELMTRLESISQEELVAAATAELDILIEEYPDVSVEDSTLGMLAERELHALLNLRIGATAPEILAEDLDGVTFRLSDYRGKVVVLDFWGHW